MSARTNRLKLWASTHREDIAVGSVFTAFTGAFVVLMAYAIKEENKRLRDEQKAYSNYVAHVDDVNHWLVDMHNSGTDVYLLNDGTYLTLDKSVPRERLIK